MFSMSFVKAGFASRIAFVGSNVPEYPMAGNTTPFMASAIFSLIIPFSTPV